MRNKLISLSFRSIWFSVIFLLFTSVTEANQEPVEKYHDALSSYYSDERPSEDGIDCAWESQNEFEEATNFCKKMRIAERNNTLKTPKTKGSYAQRIKPYRLPSDHPAKETLDFIFSQSRPIKDLNAMTDAGFEIVSIRPYSFAVIARHPDLPGYLQKVYLDSERRKKNGKEGWEWLVQRCEGAENIRKLIKKEKLQYFSVPDKWIYELPKTRQNEKAIGQQVILLVTDMELVTQEESDLAWKNIITKEHLDELYVILSNGFASSHVSWNIPYSLSGKFTCIDTEHPKREPNYFGVESYLSEDMKAYWKKIVKKGEKKDLNNSK